MSVEIDLNGSIDSDESETTNHLCIVGNLRLTKHEPLLEEVNVVVNALEFVVGDGE